MAMAFGARHVQVDQRQIQVVGCRRQQLVDAGGQHEFDPRFEFGQLGLDRFHDEPVIVGDQDFHDVTPGFG